MSDSPAYRAYKLSVSEADSGMPNGRLNMSYAALAKDAEAAVAAVKAARGKPCDVAVTDDGEDAAATVERLRLIPGQVSEL